MVGVVVVVALEEEEMPQADVDEVKNNGI